jgi:hypothetical protein
MNDSISSKRTLTAIPAEAKYNPVEALCLAHDIEPTPHETANLTGWFGRESAEVIKLVCEGLDEQMDYFKGKAAASGGKYSTFSELFPRNKDYDWTVKKLIAQAQEEVEFDAQKARLYAMDFHALGKLCAASHQRFEALRAAGEDHWPAMEEYWRHEFAYKNRVRKAFKDRDAATLRQAWKASKDVVTDALVGTGRNGTDDQIKHAECKKYLADIGIQVEAEGVAQ